jgi:hypothetical protein
MHVQSFRGCSLKSALGVAQLRNGGRRTPIATCNHYPLNKAKHYLYGKGLIGASRITLQLTDICSVDHQVVAGGESTQTLRKARSDQPLGVTSGHKQKYTLPECPPVSGHSNTQFRLSSAKSQKGGRQAAGCGPAAPGASCRQQQDPLGTDGE